MHRLPTLILAILLSLSLALPNRVQGTTPPGHRLPGGEPRTVRARVIDVHQLRTHLRISLDERRVSGTATVAFTALSPGLLAFALDAAPMEVNSVVLAGPDGPVPLEYALADGALNIGLGRAHGPGEALEVTIDYSARPASGLYFFPRTDQRSAEAWNYGEGGRHYGWLPLYNDTNDRFAVDMQVTVDAPLVALGNGELAGVKENPDGTRTWHWVQDEPIPNYLLALKVGRFVEVPLESARVGDRRVPLSVWVHQGEQERAAYAFARTPQMLEFFSTLFDYDYPWDKYDQVVLRNFAGAMETTTMVGFQESHLKTPDDPVDDTPYYDAPAPIWSYEDTIAHELAHHWFGDLVTCRSLGSLFLNESFASYAHTVWNGHVNGEDDLTYQRWLYLHAYLDFVAGTGTVRPLEYHRWDASGDMYTHEITYLKGALVLHMLRRQMGTEAFYRGLGAYLHRHAFGEVDSHDLQRALEEGSGQDLSAFFGDWIRDGGGYPVLQVSSHWSAERGQVDVTIDQVQADQPFENDFDLALDIEVVTASGSTVHRVRMDRWSQAYSLDADARPLMVTVDRGNWLVADIQQQRSLDETVHALTRGDLAAALRAARQLAGEHPRSPVAVAAMASVLSDRDRHWGLRQEAALGLGDMGSEGTVNALIRSMADPDPRIRRAVALGLGRAGGERAAAALKDAVTIDPDEEVAGAAAWSLGALHVPGAAALLVRQLDRPSAYYDYRRISALAGLAELEDPALAGTFTRYTDSRYLRETRLIALEGWIRAAPGDPALPGRLRAMARDDDPELRASALAHLGSLHRVEDLPFLEGYAAGEADPNLAKAAREAAELIRRFTP